MKNVYGPTHQVQSPLRGSDGQRLLTDKVSILIRWSDHFQTLFSTNRTVQDTALLQIPLQAIKPGLDQSPTLAETIKAINQLKSGKAAGGDSIPAKIWKHGGHTLHNKLHEFFVSCWEQERLLHDLRDAVVITLY